MDVRLYKALPDKRKEFTGILKSYENEHFVFDVEGEAIELDMARISKINLHFDF